MGPGSAEQRNRTMLRIAGRTLHRVRDARGSRGRVVICPSGSFVSSPLCKNISVFRHPKSLLELLASRPTEGRIAIVTDAGWDALDAAAFCARWDRRANRKICERSTARGRETIAAYGKTVWSWHPLLVSSRRRLYRPDRVRQNLNPPMTVTRRIRRRGEHDISR